MSCNTANGRVYIEEWLAYSKPTSMIKKMNWELKNIKMEQNLK